MDMAAGRDPVLQRLTVGQLGEILWIGTPDKVSGKHRNLP